jgi:transposase-like protein
MDNGVYLYGAVDQAGQTVDFFLSRNLDKSIQRSAMKNRRAPTKITLDAYATPPGGARDAEKPRTSCRVQVLSIQYLNNLVEQDHRRVKLGFKRFGEASVPISGIGAGREDQGGGAQDGQSRRVQCHDEGTLERGAS